MAWTATVPTAPVFSAGALTFTIVYDDGAGTVITDNHRLLGPPPANWLARTVRDRIAQLSGLAAGPIPVGLVAPAAADTPTDTALAQLRSDIGAIQTLNSLIAAGVYTTAVWSVPIVANFVQSVKDRLNANPGYLTQLY